MTYNIGDPNHLGVHNALATEVSTMADEIGVDVDLPGQKALGDTGHVADHNMIASAIDKVAQAIEINSGPGLAELVGPIVGTGTRHEFDEGGTTFYAFEFMSDCTINVNSAGIIPEVLLISGGGGGDSNGGGGGGGGGYLALSGVYVAANSYTITVGEGGAEGQNGERSIFLEYYIFGGGAGGSNTPPGVPNEGDTLAGSGGGGGSVNTVEAVIGGLGVAGQGFNGGNGNVDNFNGTGGGGGASEAGQDFPTAESGGSGGAGLASSITGSVVTRGAGGGGRGWTELNGRIRTFTRGDELTWP